MAIISIFISFINIIIFIIDNINILIYIVFFNFITFIIVLPVMFKRHPKELLSALGLKSNLKCPCFSRHLATKRTGFFKLYIHKGALWSEKIKSDH